MYGDERDKTDDTIVLKQLVAEPGDTVDAKKLGLNDEQFQVLVDGGSVRDYPFPKELQDPGVSPTQLIAQGLADSETVASTVGVSPELVKSYGEQRKKQQTPQTGEVAKP